MEQNKTANQKELESTIISVHTNVQSINDKFDSTAVLYENKFEDSFLNIPGVALFRVRFDTLAIEHANQYFLEFYGHISADDFKSSNIGFDEIFAITDVPFVIEEIEIFGTIMNYYIQSFKSQNRSQWGILNAKMSADKKFIDCSFIPENKNGFFHP